MNTLPEKLNNSHQTLEGTFGQINLLRQRCDVAGCDCKQGFSLDRK
jgi:hypothetical protein